MTFVSKYLHLVWFGVFLNLLQCYERAAECSQVSLSLFAELKVYACTFLKAYEITKSRREKPELLHVE